MPDDTKSNWWRRFISKIEVWLTPINIVAFGTTFIGTIVEFFLTMNEANNPKWYEISKEHADEIMSCLNKYMFKASWGEAVSTLFLDNWWRWEIVGWACTIGLPILVMATVFEKYNAYERAWKAIYERVKKEKICQLESHAGKNLIHELTETFSSYEVEIAGLAQRQISAIIENLKIEDLLSRVRKYKKQASQDLREIIDKWIEWEETNITDYGIDIVNSEIKESSQNAVEKTIQFSRIKKYKEQVIQDLREIIDKWIEWEENNITDYEINNEIRNNISAKTVWKNSYKKILLTITPKNGLNFSFLFITLYELVIENHYAEKFRHIIPVILHQLEHNPKYENYDKDCLKVISSAMATDTVYNIRTLLVIFLIPCVAILGTGVCVALPKFVRWLFGTSDEEENRKLIEETEKIEYGTTKIQDTNELIKPLQPLILNTNQVLI